LELTPDLANVFAILTLAAGESTVVDDDVGVGVDVPAAPPRHRPTLPAHIILQPADDVTDGDGVIVGDTTDANASVVVVVVDVGGDAFDIDSF